MEALANLTREEQVGLGVAIAAHVALVMALMLQPATREAIPTPERMSVSLADEVSLESTAPDPSAQPAAAVAPVLAPDPAPAAEPRREVVRRPDPAPPRTNPRTRPQPRPTQAATQPRRGGGSRIGDDFLSGEAAGEPSNDRGSPADVFGPAERASLLQAIARQLRPHWNAPVGPDAEQLVTIVRFRLNRDGSLAGTPQVIDQKGINPTNQAQASRHAEQAIRAVRLAAPFDLPERYYDNWKVITSTFDRRL